MQSEQLATLSISQQHHAKMFYWVKSFARIIRKNVTPLQNWKPFSLPKNVDPWVSSIAANKASQTCRAWLYNAHWRPLATPWIPLNANLRWRLCRSLLRQFENSIKYWNNCSFCKNTDGIIMGLTRIGSTNRSPAKHLCLTDAYT